MLRSRLSLFPGSMLPLKRQYRRMEGEHISSLDAFISEVYLPHVRLRKRSWTVDERIARQHLSPPSATGSLPLWTAGTWNSGCGACPPGDWPRPPATAFRRLQKRLLSREHSRPAARRAITLRGRPSLQDPHAARTAPRARGSPETHA